MYRRGEGLPQDAPQAVQWYRKAADQGYAPAQTALGAMYQSGEGVAKDPYEAVRWYRQAAEQGDQQGQFGLGAMYARGAGVAEDKAAAYMWCNLAAARGEAEAGRLRDTLEKTLTRAQVEEAQQESRQWQARHEPAKAAAAPTQP
jgi:TPR repeat protein